MMMLNDYLGGIFSKRLLKVVRTDMGSKGGSTVDPQELGRTLDKPLGLIKSTLPWTADEYRLYSTARRISSEALTKDVKRAPSVVRRVYLFTGTYIRCGEPITPKS